MIDDISAVRLTCVKCKKQQIFPTSLWEVGEKLNTKDTRKMVRSLGWYCPRLARVIIGYDAAFRNERIVNIIWDVECPDCHQPAKVLPFVLERKR